MRENLYVEHLDDGGRIIWAACDFVGNPDLSKPPMPPAPSSPTAEGRKDDSDKVRFELIPPELLFAVGEILTFGARKYADRNWEAGMKWSRVFGALMRHMWCWWGGAQPTGKNFVFGDLDMETGKSHLWHAGCCLAFLISYEERRIGTDDRPGTEQPVRKEPPPAKMAHK